MDRFIAENTFPLVESKRCTFFFRGHAEKVAIRHWVFGLPSSAPLVRLGPDLWCHVLELPDQSRFEYKIEVTEGHDTRLIKDPLNPHEASDPFGSNSVCRGFGYQVPEWAEYDAEARPGHVEERTFESHALGHARRIPIYFPARFRPTRRYPLLLVHDGPDYMHHAGLITVLDNLIHRLEIPSLVAALVPPGDRMGEYTGSVEHARFLTDELVPALEKELPLVGRPEGRCLMGASLGAVASFATAGTHPGFYGRLLLQSGSFAFTDIGENRRGPVLEPVVQFMNAYRENPVSITEKLFLSCGMYESLIYENRSLVPLLQETSMQVKYVEARDGHNWENWRDRLREGLSWLFPGPLWMVYE